MFLPTPENFTVAVDIGSSDFHVAHSTEDDGTHSTVLTAADRTALLNQDQQPLASGNTAAELQQLLSCVFDVTAAKVAYAQDFRHVLERPKGAPVAAIGAAPQDLGGIDGEKLFADFLRLVNE